MPEAVIVSAARSPIGRANKGSLKDFRPDDLTVLAVQAALDKIPDLDPTAIEDLLLGCGLPGGESGNNMARVVTTLLGLEVPARRSPATAPRRCRPRGWRSTRSRPARATSSSPPASRRSPASPRAPPTTSPTPATRSSRTPAHAPRSSPKGGQDWHDPREDGQLPDIYVAMGQTAENVARLRGLDRKELDEFAVRSQNLAEKAIADGFWEREITPVTTPDGTVVSKDDGPRAGVTYDAIAGLDPVFRPDGVVTAGNCCALNDGAAAVVVMSDTKAAELGLTPLARIVSTGVSGLSPEIMGLGPVEATKNALRYAGMSIGDIDLVEINEAFAAQVVPSYQDLGIDLDRLNVNGGAIAVGHPFGMTGARLQNTMLNSLDWHDKSTGLITMCVGGGQGMAMILERVS